MDQTTQFKSDLSNFLQTIKNSENLSEIKKEYVNLVKKYHPDTAPAELKQKYNEYMIIVMMYGNFEDSYLKTSAYNPNDNSNLLEAMQHLYNASKCFNYIINKHPDYIFIEQVKEDYGKVLKLNNSLSQHIVGSDSKELR